jgi:hypothetical protein
MLLHPDGGEMALEAADTEVTCRCKVRAPKGFAGVEQSVDSSSNRVALGMWPLAMCQFALERRVSIGGVFTRV